MRRSQPCRCTLVRNVGGDPAQNRRWDLNERLAHPTAKVNRQLVPKDLAGMPPPLNASGLSRTIGPCWCRGSRPPAGSPYESLEDTSMMRRIKPVTTAVLTALLTVGP